MLQTAEKKWAAMDEGLRAMGDSSHQYLMGRSGRPRGLCESARDLSEATGMEVLAADVKARWERLEAAGDRRVPESDKGLQWDNSLHRALDAKLAPKSSVLAIVLNESDDVGIAAKLKQVTKIEVSAEEIAAFRREVEAIFIEHQRQNRRKPIAETDLHVRSAAVDAELDRLTTERIREAGVRDDGSPKLGYGQALQGVMDEHPELLQGVARGPGG